VSAGKVLVDGLGVGDVGNIVLRDRMHLAQDGLIVVVVTIDGESGLVIAGPDIVSRGFVTCGRPRTLWKRPGSRLKAS
jgi:ribonuclease J